MQYIFDLLTFGIVGYFIWLGLKEGVNKPLYDLFKIFFGVTLAGIYAGKSAVFLGRIGLIRPDSTAVALVIGFGTVFLLYWGVLRLIETYGSRVDPKKVRLSKKASGAFLNGVEALMAVTVVSFFLMQLTLAKTYIRPILVKSLTYPPMERICRRVIDREFVNAIVFGSTTGTSGKEVLVKTLTDKKVWDELSK